MKRFPTGGFLFETIDVICISVSVGGALSYLYKKYKKIKRRKRIGNDPLVTELKEKSPIIMISDQGQSVKLPLLRGGDLVNLSKPRVLLSVVLKNRKIANLIRAIVVIKSHQRKIQLIQLIQYFFFMANNIMTYNFHLRLALAGSLDYTQIILIASPSTLGGFLLGLAYPLAATLLPLVVLAGRGIEDIDITDPSIKCRALCKYAEEFHNNQLKLEMRKITSVVEESSAAFQLPLEKSPLVCVEEKLSLVERYKLRAIIESNKTGKRVQHFSEFIKKFPECDPDPKSVYDEIIKKISE